MTQTRRSGIRLPWSHEDELENGPQPAEDAASAGAPTDEAAGSAQAGTNQQSAPSASNAPAPVAADDAAEQTLSDEDNVLLAELVSAMREVAERERSSSVASLKTSVDEAVERLRLRAAEGADQLRSRADLDIAGIADWVKAEIQRIEGEGRTKTEARRQQLTDQLAEHEEHAQREIEAMQARSTDYEQKLTSFFAELYEIADPAAFGSAAKRMPRPPKLEVAAAAPAASAVTPATPEAAAAPEAPATPEAAEAVAGPEPTEAVAAPEPTEAASKALAEAPVDSAAAVEAASEPEAMPEPPTSEAATEPAEPATEAMPAGETLRDRMDALGIAREPAAAADEPAAPDAEAPEPELEAGGLAARLAQLDARIGASTPPDTAVTTVAAPAPSGEVATAIMVAGLGSFGAITSFKQALERVEGVHGISLSLGPTGEFVYRATHAPEFDLAAAIEQIERGTAKIDRQADGSLRVTVQRSR